MNAKNEMPKPGCKPVAAPVATARPEVRGQRSEAGKPKHRMMISPVRAAVCLAAIFHLLSAIFAAQAATVTGLVYQVTGSGDVTRMIFARTNAVQLSSGGLVGDIAVNAKVTNKFSFSLLSADYDVTVGAAIPFRISVPDTNATYNITSLISSGTITYTYTNPISTGGGTTYTNRGDLPAGVIVGGAVGTNTGHLVGTNHTGNVTIDGTLAVGDGISDVRLTKTGPSGEIRIYRDGSLETWFNTDVDGTYYNNTQGNPLFGKFSGNGAGLTNIPGTSLTGTITGNGAGLTNLDVSAVTNYLPASGVLAAIAFRESRLGFPGVDVEEAGRFIYSYDYGKSWKGGMGYPHFRSAKAGWGLRDPALVEVGNNLAVAFTESTNSIGRTNFPIYASTANYSYWPQVTNISMALAGETVTTNWYQWSPVFAVDGGTVYLFGSVNTNGGTNGAVGSWETRYKTTTTNLFPYGWSATSRTTNNTGATNILDLTPFQDTNGLWSAWYKNEASTGANAKRVQLGRFEGGPGTAFSDVLTGDFVSIAGQLWNANVEGNWMVQLPDGRYRVFMTRYSQADYNYNGEGRMLCYAETSAGTAYTNAASWSLLTNATVVFYCQSFKPIRLSSPAKIANWIALTEGQNYMRGQVNIMPEIGVSGPSGLTKFGWAYTNPYPADSYSGIFTNDHAGVRFGVHGQGGGIYGLSDRSVRLWVPTLTSSDANWALPEFAKDILTLTSNSVTFAAGVRITNMVNIYGGGTGLNLFTTGGQNITFQPAGAVGVYGNLNMWGGSIDMKTHAISGVTTLTGSNLVALATQPTTNGLGSQGGIIGCNGTNWWTVMRNSAGGLATNKLTLEAWP